MNDVINLFHQILQVVCACLISYVVADISLGSQVPIVAQESEVNPDGSYSYNYETGNGIRGQEQGVGGVRAQGQFSWSAPDGTPVQFSYGEYFRFLVYLKL